MPRILTHDELKQKLYERSELNENGCWIWQRARTYNGYGRLKLAGRMQRAHRLAYTAFIGAIPEGFCICHRCDTPACVNPKHLFLGTQQDNVQDRHNKNRNAKGAAHGVTKLIEQDILYIRSSSLTRVALARKFNVSVSAIGRIRSRKYWSHI